MSRRQTKSFLLQQFFKNVAEVWASSPHLRSKLDICNQFSLLQLHVLKLSNSSKVKLLLQSRNFVNFLTTDHEIWYNKRIGRKISFLFFRRASGRTTGNKHKNRKDLMNMGLTLTEKNPEGTSGRRRNEKRVPKSESVSTRP